MKLFLYVFAFASCNLFGQLGNIGINTANPSARLQINTSGNSSTTKALRLQYPLNTEITSLRNDGSIAVGKTNPDCTVDVLSSAGTDLLIERSTILTVTLPNGTTTSYKPSLRHYTYQSGGSYNNANYGGQLLLFDLEGNAVNNTADRGIFIGPAKSLSQPAGIFFGANGYTGISLDRLPTTDLDVGGSIRLRESPIAVANGDACKERKGELRYYKGHFYGCNDTWQQIDN